MTYPNRLGNLEGAPRRAEADGYLRDFDTGLDTSVWVEMTGANITGSISAAPNVGTDAYDLFLDTGGVNLGDFSVSYNNSGLD